MDIRIPQNRTPISKSISIEMFHTSVCNLLPATFGKVVFIEVMTNLWKPDKPVEVEFDYYKLHTAYNLYTA